MRLLLLLLLLLILPGCEPVPATSDRPLLNRMIGTTQENGFLMADRGRPFGFPRDHLPHDGFRNEWWYFTGNLDTRDGRRFGYQVTLFRIALLPEPVSGRRSDWAISHLWMGHLAITDIDSSTHHSSQRFSREALGLAGSATQPFRIWLENWQIKVDDGTAPWHLRFTDDNLAIDLELSAVKPIVLQGDRGLSQKSARPGNASYYYSIPRLATQGTLRVDGTAHEVTGLSWLDREWSSSALDDHQLGWDWFSLQLDSGEELMYYRLRNRQQGTDPYSTGVWIYPDGSTRRLRADEVELTPTRWWQAADRVRYPVGWKVRVQPLQRTLEIDTPVDDQEMNGLVRYWEGSIDVSEASSVVGRGYLEMTGYDQAR